ncbi:Zinc finger protein zic [Plakobranchus ocellatus]|uniref:Zinc finger protein zic n=1 Tax=Plakobranchus ocellatus TaxID=259542 RepID=A0AAV3XSB7_9GAST|nr:Zinc finger protein zic [Plakobranchus ocellatus]
MDNQTVLAFSGDYKSRNFSQPPPLHAHRRSCRFPHCSCWDHENIPLSNSPGIPAPSVLTTSVSNTCPRPQQQIKSLVDSWRSMRPIPCRDHALLTPPITLDTHQGSSRR